MKLNFLILILISFLQFCSSAEERFKSNVRFGSREDLKNSIESIDVNSDIEEGYQVIKPLEFAAFNCNVEAVKQLVARGADVNGGGKIDSDGALNRAVQMSQSSSNREKFEDCAEVVEFLISKKADPNLVIISQKSFKIPSYNDESGTKPLFFIRRNKQIPIFKALLKGGMNINSNTIIYKDNTKNEDKCHYPLFSFANDFLSIINSRDEGIDELIKEMIKSGADTKATCRDKTVYQEAKLANNKRVIEILEANGVKQ